MWKLERQQMAKSAAGSKVETPEYQDATPEHWCYQFKGREDKTKVKRHPVFEERPFNKMIHYVRPLRQHFDDLSVKCTHGKKGEPMKGGAIELVCPLDDRGHPEATQYLWMK